MPTFDPRTGNIDLLAHLSARSKYYIELFGPEYERYRHLKIPDDRFVSEYVTSHPEPWPTGTDYPVSEISMQ